jgi:diguanylate cyclase (GGDEF)-like protein
MQSSRGDLGSREFQPIAHRARTVDIAFGRTTLALIDSNPVPSDSREVTLLSWEQILSNVLHRIRLDSVRRKILVFSLVATLIPSVTIGVLFYVYANRFLTDKVADQLRDVTAQNVREIDLWLKERLYEVRVFSSSYEVSENLDTITRAGIAPGVKAPALRRLSDYLVSVRGKFGDYEELAVVNSTTQTIATSAKQLSTLSFPPDWQLRARADTPIMGQAYRDPGLDKMVMLLAVPIRAQDGRLLGLLAVKLNFRSVEEILARSTLASTGRTYLIAQDGAVIAGSHRTASGIVDVKQLFATGNEPETDPSLLEYLGADDKPVVGVSRRLSQLDWAVLAEIGKEEVYAQTVRIRGLTVAIGVALLLAIGLAAYILGLTIVRPLNRLTDGAAKVAGGDLGVKLPVISRGEVGYLTQAFNEMVERLRQDQEQLAAVNKQLTDRNQELQALSITDGLTGLYNRKHFLEVLGGQISRATRGRLQFSLAMIDADHFKEYNDTLGHQAGDVILKTIGTILQESLRSMDYAFRYGGDELIVLLPDVTIGGAVEVAERIRAKMAEAKLGGETNLAAVTVSIGVASFPEHGETPETIIASADGALYDAKRNGRNRVVVAGSSRHPDLGIAS